MTAHTSIFMYIHLLTQVFIQLHPSLSDTYTHALIQPFSHIVLTHILLCTHLLPVQVFSSPCLAQPQQNALSSAHSFKEEAISSQGCRADGTVVSRVGHNPRDVLIASGDKERDWAWGADSFHLLDWSQQTRRA